MLLSATIRYRFNLPSMNVLAKSDMLSEEELKIIEGMGDVDFLHDSAMGEGGLTGELNFQILRAMSEMDALAPLVNTSAQKNLGIVDIYNNVQLNFAGGEDLSSD